MSVYDVTVEELPSGLAGRVCVQDSAEVLQKAVAAEFADLLADAAQKGDMLTLICPVGPLNYRFFADEVIRRGLSCRHLRTVNMDEYLDDNDRLIPIDHPLSFRRFMEETFFAHLPTERRPLPENIVFPDPAAPERVTELIDEIGGADMCWAGFGITGHVAFNDPPSMLGEPDSLESFRQCKTRTLTISPMSTAQMAMGGTNGNMEILPTRAVTVGMYEMLKSKRFHCTFMRSWHAGLWRRAFLGPITQTFPGSLLQEHPNLWISMTQLAATPPLVNTAQATGEEN
ncbi:MAG: glucosamine-6-phosphate isomerase [Lentisphaerae bacterium]|jgi:glucosamine-6-phosphate deaminase|nr:glucosamine-6-phosphate isomerase [Lentisphaerota bacterium]MBT4820324.1 glucosamine-6-phosphate isomerase [Lentisphaerota bacterium]MBT5610891.1 glucosamine-6-phosphate isomerase [Lentisphaerota bacterium]MBT7059515.1 glucosamine-6-phosphate isomerase [Lentisphaerota bacterium]MBT7846717.1 glucosamine-6-phosphate isomerase [Lentisphaerota bacterium]